ncbi:hypothetical protein Y037_6005 [Burkholderia pseudomallei MSHR983]|nr:hypothetical protein Y037_6005 [Burkholderia pseudomallei MSHR983]
MTRDEAVRGGVSRCAMRDARCARIACAARPRRSPGAPARIRAMIRLAAARPAPRHMRIARPCRCARATVGIPEHHVHRMLAPPAPRRPAARSIAAKRAFIGAPPEAHRVAVTHRIEGIRRISPGRLALSRRIRAYRRSHANEASRSAATSARAASRRTHRTGPVRRAGRAEHRARRTRLLCTRRTHAHPQTTSSIPRAVSARRIALSGARSVTRKRAASEPLIRTGVTRPNFE